MMSNVDAAEIRHFSSMASRWWDPRGEMAALHHINPARVRYIENAVGGLRGKAVVDVGCGAGILTEALAARGATALGIDLAEASLEVAKLHGLESGIQCEYRCVSSEQLAAEMPGAFDAVCCMEMLEHVPDPASVIKACAALVKPGGDLIFSTINRNPKAYMLMIVGAEMLSGLVPRGTHEYAKFIRPSELEAWCRAAGLTAIEIKGMRYNPLLKSATVGRDMDVNYLMHCRRDAA